jgi:hypothetical protein
MASIGEIWNDTMRLASEMRAKTRKTAWFASKISIKVTHNAVLERREGHD